MINKMIIPVTCVLFGLFLCFSDIIANPFNTLKTILNCCCCRTKVSNLKKKSYLFFSQTPKINKINDSTFFNDLFTSSIEVFLGVALNKDIFLTNGKLFPTVLKSTKTFYLNPNYSSWIINLNRLSQEKFLKEFGQLSLKNIFINLDIIDSWIFKNNKNELFELNIREGNVYKFATKEVVFIVDLRDIKWISKELVHVNGYFNLLTPPPSPNPLSSPSSKRLTR